MLCMTPRLERVFKQYHLTGQLPVDHEILEKLWDNKWYIHYSGPSQNYFLIRRYFKGYNIKGEISADDAKQIINKYNLCANKHKIFNHISYENLH